MSKKKIIILSLVGVVILSVIIVMNLGNDKSTALEVQTAKVTRQKIIQSVNANGRIQPVIQVKISADVSAKIMKLGVNEGQWVEKGDFLVELDRERHLASVESAEAAVRSAQANANLAKENLIKTEKDYERSKELFEKNLESQATLDAMFAAFKVEKARYASALDQVEQARAVLKQANDDLAKTKIHAPMAGTISKLNKEVSEIALGSQFQEDVIMIISNLAGMEALVDVDENDIVSVSIGDSAKIEVDALPDYLFRGEVTEIASSATISSEGSADQKTDFEVKIAVTGVYKSTEISEDLASNGEIPMMTSDPISELRPGMTSTTDIMVEANENAISVPIQSVAVRTVDQLKKDKKEGEEDAEGEPHESGIKPDKDGFVEVVFIVKDGKALAIPVETGIQSDTHIEIISGLSEGDEVVTGNYRAISKDLSDGMEVTVANKEQGT